MLIITALLLVSMLGGALIGWFVPMPAAIFVAALYMVGIISLTAWIGAIVTR